MKDRIKSLIRDSIMVKELMLEESAGVIADVAVLIMDAYRNGRKVIVFGNGGSAADAQHLAAEFVCRFEKDRDALECVALTTNSSMLTAVGNDYGFERIFARQVEAAVRAGDVVIGISTSGNSQNVILAMEEAKKRKAATVAWTGANGGRLKGAVDYCVRIPSDNTARIQEGHLLLIHLLCALIEQELFKGK